MHMFDRKSPLVELQELVSRVYFCSLLILTYLATDIRYGSVRNLVHTVTLDI